MASFREINYAVRPAKSVERKIMAEAFRRLEMSWPLSTYRYIGMGSVYFADFQLFHQALGIEDMVSIEREKQYEARFEFNRPFRCVEIKFGESADILDTLAWEKRSLVWLDYDGKLEASVISDLQTVVQKVISGSVVTVSVNVEADRPPAEVTGADATNAWRLNELEGRIGQACMPAGVSGEELRGKSFGAVCWRVLNAAVVEQLTKRNGRADLRPDTMISHQVFHFRYSDGVPMLTVGWLFRSREDEEKTQRCAMKGSYFRDGDEPCVIEAPKLTPKEIRHLNSRLPDGPPVGRAITRQLEKTTGIGESDINKFAEVYRYYPQYGEVVL